MCFIAGGYLGVDSDSFENVVDLGMGSPLDDEALAGLKIPPHSIEAEQSVLGGLMINSQAWENVAEQVAEADFYRGAHRKIFKQMAALIEASEPVDIITLSEALNSNDELDEVGGLNYLAELAKNTPSVANIRSYAAVVSERAGLRNLIRAANDIAESAYSPEGRTSDDLLEEAERSIMKISEDRPKEGGPVEINSLLKGSIEKIDELFNSDGTITGITTGFKDLDEMTSGMQATDLIIVAARPSMGKTTFAMNLVENAIMAQDKPALVFSMEMPSESIVMRMLSSLGRINQTKVRNGQLDEEDWPKLTTAAAKLKDEKLFIDDSSALTPTEIRSRALRIEREHGPLAMIMIDYFRVLPYLHLRRRSA